LRVGDVPAAELTGPRPPRFAAIPFEGRLRRAQLFVTPLADAAAYASAWPQAQCLLTLVLPEVEHPAAVQSWLNALGRHHGLTGAEVRVLGLLAGGQDAAAMASSLGVSLATIRTHIRALFDKTGVRRQAELVRLALAG
jgi:DNA-binding CsgD family transcriptional regulator